MKQLLLNMLSPDPTPVPEPDPTSLSGLLELAQRNRLEPYLFTRWPQAWSSPAAQDVLETLRNAYTQCTLRSGVFLQAASEVLNRLSWEYLPCLAFRGPFQAAEFYRDPGARYFQDLDLLVPRSRRREALALCEESGWDLRYQALPRRFLERYHLHYALEQKDQGVCLDLHWALDHPYALWKIDYAGLVERSRKVSKEGITWRRPCIEDLLLLQAVHLIKHVRSVPESATADPASWALENGAFRFWLDAGLTLQQAAERVSWDTLAGRARAWYAERALGLLLDGLRGWSGVELPDLDLGQRAKGRVAQQAKEKGVLHGLARAGGFRPPQGAWVWSYVWPPRNWFSTRRGGWRLAATRVTHAVKASALLGLAGFDALLHAGCLWWNRKKTGGATAGGISAVLVFLTLVLGAVGLSADDHGNQAEEATSIVPDGQPVAGLFEVDVDRDWFRWPARPGAAYALQITTGTVWDAEIQLVLPDGQGVLSSTSTVDQAGGALVTWTNSGAAGTLYARCTPFALFTTGDYALAVTESGFTDTDQDGLHDDWEMQHFNTLARDGGGDYDGDSFSDSNEFAMATIPTNALSGLFIVDLQDAAGPGSLVRWSAAPYGLYEVESRSISEAAWASHGQVVATNAVGQMTVPRPAVGTNRWYRVLFRP